MDPVSLVLVPSLIGGAVIATVSFLSHQRRQSVTAVPYRAEPLSTDIINAARIKVAGIGGLGLVAMALTVALNVPRIFQTLAVGLVLGAVGAAILVVRRRSTGAMPSSGRRRGANTTLSIDLE